MGKKAKKKSRAKKQHRRFKGKSRSSKRKKQKQIKNNIKWVLMNANIQIGLFFKLEMHRCAFVTPALKIALFFVECLCLLNTMWSRHWQMTVFCIQLGGHVKNLRIYSSEGCSLSLSLVYCTDLVLFLPIVLSLPPWHGVELGSETLAKSATSDYLLCGQLIARRPHSVQRHLPKWMEPKGQSLPTWCREEEITKSQDKQSCPVLSQVAQLCWGAKLLLYFVGSLSHILTHSEL